MNIFDYLKWRDDLELKEINEIDALVLSKVSYFPLEYIMTYEEKLTFKDLYERTLIRKCEWCNNQDEELLKVIANSKRYKDLTVTKVVSILDEEKEEQYLAVTININRNTVFLSFRGTSPDIIGWKEDFNMGFLESVPAQIDALDYLKKTSIFKKVYIGGHSKGGNIAMYAGIHASNIRKTRIKRIFNFDGPGFMNLDENYYRINKKIISFLPGASIVGRIMNQDNESKIVESANIGIFQHNLFNWHIEKDKFVEGTFTEESNEIKNRLDEWISSTTTEERKELVNSIYEVIKSSGAKKTSDDLKLADLKKVLLKVKNMDDLTRKNIIMLMSNLFLKKEQR